MTKTLKHSSPEVDLRSSQQIHQSWGFNPRISGRFKRAMGWTDANKYGFANATNEGFMIWGTPKSSILDWDVQSTKTFFWGYPHLWKHPQDGTGAEKNICCLTAWLLSVTHLKPRWMLTIRTGGDFNNLSRVRKRPSFDGVYFHIFLLNREWWIVWFYMVLLTWLKIAHVYATTPSPSWS